MGRDVELGPKLTETSAMGRIYLASEEGRREARRWFRRSRPTIAACVDRPADLDVVSHNHRVCRFSGWVVSPLRRDVTVMVQAPGGSFAVTPEVPRPDIVAAYGRTYGFEDPVCGFQFYVDVPPLSGNGEATVALEFTDGQTTARSDTFRLSPDVDPGQIDTYVGDGFAKRELAERRLAGRGLELGALHQPLEVDRSRCEMSYADRLTRQQAVEMFPELEAFVDRMVEPDVLIDVATDDLEPLAESNYDFVVANDVIEHLPNPIRFLRDVAAILRPGALLFLSVPDRDYTFDVGREVTPLEHLWDEFERGVTDVDDDHIHDFLAHTLPGPLPESEVERAALFEYHRARSIHVHVWDQSAFDALLDDVIQRLDLGLAITDRISSPEGDGSMVYVFEKH